MSSKTGDDHVRRVVSELQAAALAAICALTNERVDPAEDPNPYTARLTPYDLARLFNLDPSGTMRSTAISLDDVETVLRQTSLPRERRQMRAMWVATELARLGHQPEAARFEQLAEV